MKDRIPTYPGRVKLTPVPGSENLFDMKRADEPIQEGTPMNKATFLRDETASILGLPDTSVPDDAFRVLHSEIQKGQVGDIRISAVDLEAESGGKWLACDGRELSIASYKKLHDILGESHGTVFDGTSVQKYKATAATDASYVRQVAVSAAGVMAFNYSSGTSYNSANKIYVVLANGTTVRTMNTAYYQVSLFWIGEELFIFGTTTSGGHSLSLYKINYSSSTLTATQIVSGVYAAKGILGYYPDGDYVHIVVYGGNGQSSTDNYTVLSAVKLNLTTATASVTTIGKNQYSLSGVVVLGSRVYYRITTGTAFAGYYDLLTGNKTSVAETSWPLSDADLLATDANFAYSVFIQQPNVLCIVNTKTRAIQKRYLTKLTTNGLVDFTSVMSSRPTDAGAVQPHVIISTEGKLDVYCVFSNASIQYLCHPTQVGDTYQVPFFESISRISSLNPHTTEFLPLRVKSFFPNAFPLYAEADETNGTLFYREGVSTTKFKLPTAFPAALAVGSSTSTIYTAIGTILPFSLTKDIFIKAKE